MLRASSDYEDENIADVDQGQKKVKPKKTGPNVKRGSSGKKSAAKKPVARSRTGSTSFSKRKQVEESPSDRASDDEHLSNDSSDSDGSSEHSSVEAEFSLKHHQKKFKASVSVSEPDKQKKRFSKALKQESATNNLLPSNQRELITLARAASQTVFRDAMKWQKYSGYSHATKSLSNYRGTFKTPVKAHLATFIAQQPALAGLDYSEIKNDYYHIHQDGKNTTSNFFRSPLLVGCLKVCFRVGSTSKPAPVGNWSKYEIHHVVFTVLMMEHVLDNKSKFELESLASRKTELEETLKDFLNRKPQESEAMMKYLWDASGDGKAVIKDTNAKLRFISSPERG